MGLAVILHSTQSLGRHADIEQFLALHLSRSLHFTSMYRPHIPPLE